VVDRYWKGDTFMAKLFPSIAANASGHLQVSSDHSIFWEECGFTTGIPVVYLHGGPGGGIDESDR
jgi:proline iminopeptidase